MEANRAESERCFEIANKHYSDGNRDKALKFLRKADRLCPSDKISELILVLESTDADPATPGYSAYEHYSDIPRHRGSRKDGSECQNGRRPRSSSRAEDPGSPNEPPDPPMDPVNNSSRRARTPSCPRQPEYTQEQLEAVKRIKRCKDYYEILSLTKENFSDAELKKSYRKLALQFHPDKNNAPGAMEAFKAIGNAYAVLSDAGKRRSYDLHGSEGPATMQRNRSSGYSRGFEAEFSPEEIFNMFFGGGFPSSTVHRRRGQGGTYYYEHTSSRTQSRSQSSQNEHSNETNLGVLLQLMPFILLVGLSLFSTLLMGDQSFSLHRTDRYTVERHTGEVGIAYYVKPDFLKKYSGQVYKIERQVEADYSDLLRSNCYRERIQKEHRLWQARTYGDAASYERASKAATPSCDRLQTLYA